jgi:hypothetical protein
MSKRGPGFQNDINLSDKFVRSFFKRDRNDIFVRFIHQEIVTKNPDLHYIVGKTGQNYKWHPQLNNWENHSEVVIEDTMYQKLQNKIQSIINTPLGQYIENNLNELQVNSQKVEYLLDNLSGTTNQILNIKNAWYSLSSHTYDITQSQKTGRVFHPVAYSKRELRSYLETQNEDKFLEIDMSNSQLWFLAQLIKGTGGLTSEINSFIRACEAGKIYEMLMENTSYTRDRVKTACYEGLFPKWRGPRKRKPSLFKNLPETLARIEYLREKYFNLAVKLQKMEAEMFINRILNKLKKAGIWALPLHDSVMFKKKDREKVLEIFKNEFLQHRYYKCIPPYKIKDL